MWWQEGWIWVAAGVVLGAAEMLLPGFVLLGTAVGLALVGGLIWLGVLGGSLPLMLLVAALGGLAAWAFLRRVVGVRPGQVKLWDRDINDN